MINIPKFTLDLAVILSAVGLIGLIGRLVHRVSRYLDHMSAMLRSWEGTPDRPGVLERLDDIEDTIKDIQYHVKPNHGNSSVDAQNAQLAEIISFLRRK